MFTKQMHQETDAEKEVLDLKRMQVRTHFIEMKKILQNIFPVNRTGITYIFVVVSLSLSLVSVVHVHEIYFHSFCSYIYVIIYRMNATIGSMHQKLSWLN
jgi:hypothetical protein